MKPQISSRRRTRPFTLFGFAGLLAIVIAAPAVRDQMWARDEVIASPIVKSPAAAGRSRGLWYIQLGQWRADARTLVAAFRYVLESDTQTNQGKPTGRFVGLELVMLTNSTLVVPKA